MNAIWFGMSLFSSFNLKKKVLGPDLPALEGDFDSIGGRSRGAGPAKRAAAGQLGDHFQRFDPQRPRHLARSVPARYDDPADFGDTQHFSEDRPQRRAN